MVEVMLRVWVTVATDEQADEVLRAFKSWDSEEYLSVVVHEQSRRVVEP